MHLTVRALAVFTLAAGCYGPDVDGCPDDFDACPIKGELSAPTPAAAPPAATSEPVGTICAGTICPSDGTTFCCFNSGAEGEGCVSGDTLLCGTSLLYCDGPEDCNGGQGERSEATGGPTCCLDGTLSSYSHTYCGLGCTNAMCHRDSDCPYSAHCRLSGAMGVCDPPLIN